MKPFLLGEYMIEQDEKMISHDKLISILDYDADTGLFKWKSNRGKRKKNDIAGSINSKGYVVINTDCYLYKAHRLAWFYVNKSWPEHFIDHINGIKHDNRISNLREADSIQNQMNKAIGKSNTSGYKGVCWNNQALKWQAKTKVNGKHVYLGFFDIKEDAANAYQVYVKALHGEYFAGEDRITSIKK